MQVTMQTEAGAMWAEDEAVFARAVDESRSGCDRIVALRGDLAAGTGTAERAGLVAELMLALSMFELHGATLRRLTDWYPDEGRVRRGAQEWNLLQLRVESRSTRLDVAHV